METVGNSGLLEETRRVDNFRVSSGKIKGSFRGLYFNDSDVYKWIEAFSFAYAWTGKEELVKMAENVINEVVAAQEQDGYLNTYFSSPERRVERWRNLRDMHELYCGGHLIQAAIAHRRATGEEALYGAALKLADHVVRTFRRGGVEAPDGHPEAEMAFVELYRESRRTEYLGEAQFLLDQRGKGLIGGDPYHLDHLPFRQVKEVPARAHAVRALYLFAGATDLYMETGEEGLMDVLQRLWKDLNSSRIYIT